MSTLKPLRKPDARAARRRSVTAAASPRRSEGRLIAAGVLVAVLVVVGVLIVRSQMGATGGGSDVPLDRAVRPLSAPTGQTAEGYWYKGQADAPVTVTVFGDFQCPSCQAAFTRIEGGIDTNYVETGKIRFVFHDYPLPMHANAVPAALAARAAGAQGKFWAMHDVLYARQAEWQGDRDPSGRFKRYATELGLDRGAFDAAFDGGELRAAIDAAVAAGRQRGINSTPTYQIDGKTVDTAGLAAAIDAALKAKGR